MGNVGVRYLMIAAGNRCFAPLFLCPLRLFPLVSFVSSYSVYNPRVASDCPATMLRSFDKSQSLKMTRKSSPKRTLRREKVEEEEELELIECRANNVDMDMDDDYEAQNKALEEMLEKDKKDLVEQAEQIMENKKKAAPAMSIGGISSVYLRSKNEWLPPNWEKIMKDLKKQGRDVKSTDLNLASLGREQEKVKTGKYLMPSDIFWCRSRSTFSEKALVNWHKMFRKECDEKTGKISSDGIVNLFKFAFPLAEADKLIPAMKETIFASSDSLDFKEVIRFLDCANCKTLKDKLTWAAGIISGAKRRSIPVAKAELFVHLMDLVEKNGFVNGATEEEIDELLYKKPEQPLLSADQRVEKVLSEVIVARNQSVIQFDKIVALPEKIIYARVKSFEFM